MQGPVTMNLKGQFQYPDLFKGQAKGTGKKRVRAVANFNLEEMRGFKLKSLHKLGSHAPNKTQAFPFTKKIIEN